MERITKAVDHELYVVDNTKIQHGEYGYTGEAVSKLAKFEDMYDNLLVRQGDITVELAKLRMEGKSNSVKFKQLLANKLMNNDIISLFETYGL